MINLFVMVNMQILSKHGPTFYGGATRCLGGESIPCRPVAHCQDQEKTEEPVVNPVYE